MAAFMKANFEGFAPYKLSYIKASGRELGRGSYATVLELDYMGLKCAGKKIHGELLLQGDASYAVVRFQEECRLLSQVRHPNIVQFLGIYFFQQETAPILVMEFLPTNLTSCIEQYGILPKEVSYTILHDVAIGLCYLHSQTPPIIHRDLSSNNVLLTPNMNAKISDLGVARILSLTPLQFSRMTQTPGTPAYMPPEVMVANPKYDTSIDIFSFGVMIIHVLSGQWPEPQIGPNKIDPETERLVPVSEAERRETFLDSIGRNHPLMDLIITCIDNNHKRRPSASSAVKQLTEMVSQISAQFANRLEMLRRIEADEKEKMTLKMERERRHEETRQKEKKIASLKEEGERNEVKKSEQFSQLQLAFSTEAEQQRLRIDDLVSQIQVLSSEKQSISRAVEVAQKEKEALATQMSKYKKEMKLTLKSFEDRMYDERDRQQQQLTEEKERYEKYLQEERELLKKANAQNLTLEAKVTSLRLSEEQQKSSLSAIEALLATKKVELEVKAKALLEKDVTISGMTEQLHSARKFLATTQQSFQTNIMWTKCADLPEEVPHGRSTTVNGKVYFIKGAMQAEEESPLYCYDTLQNEWYTLPALSIRHFGLGHIGDKLVTLGGIKSPPSKERVSDMYTLVENTGKWKKFYSPMPTARSSPVVFSLESALIVAGGYSYREGRKVLENVVEVFKVKESQWYVADELPLSLQRVNMFGTVLNTKLYLIGGIRVGATYSTVLSTSVTDLINNAVPANHKTSHDDIPPTNWKGLPDTPTNKTAVTSLGGLLITLGGEKNAIHMYSPSIDSWVHIGSLPDLRLLTTVSVLSPMEILMIGGFDGSKDVNTVYKGTLQLSS